MYNNIIHFAHLTYVFGSMPALQPTGKLDLDCRLVHLQSRTLKPLTQATSLFWKNGYTCLILFVTSNVCVGTTKQHQEREKWGKVYG